MTKAFKSLWTPKKIKTLRARLKMSQENFAEVLGVAFCTVNRWEGGWFPPSRIAVRAMEALESALVGKIKDEPNQEDDDEITTT